MSTSDDRSCGLNSKVLKIKEEEMKNGGLVTRVESSSSVSHSLVLLFWSSARRRGRAQDDAADCRGEMLSVTHFYFAFIGEARSKVTSYWRSQKQSDVVTY